LERESAKRNFPGMDANPAARIPPFVRNSRLVLMNTLFEFEFLMFITGLF